MAERKASWSQRWEEWRPSKGALFWSCVSISILTMVIGFTWGGWMTGGSAQEMTQEARRNLAATFCVQRFLNQPDAAARHAALMEISAWQRDDFVQDGGWAKLPTLDRPLGGIAALCADKLATVEAPAGAAQSTTGASTTDQPDTTVVQ